ncbi:MAG: insulinase family protein [Candidatus Taylorbacteria bacterium]|nr:insulinase family protein [Candidatus Taylorbacteria bacterium]
MNFNKHILKNGLRVITVLMKDNPTATVLVLVAAGSKYETKKINGLSHFLEHMCFKGTKKRPRSIDISHELDSVGAQYNAFTSQEWTGYYAKAAARHSPMLIDIVSDIYLNSTLPEAEMQKEKGVIIEEINMYNDLPQRKVQDIFLNLLYGDQPAGWDIAGTKENVSGMKHADFVSYRTKFYTAPETLVVVSGSINEAEVLKLVEQSFAECSPQPGAGKLPVKEAQSKPAILTEKRKTDQTHFVLGVRTFDAYDKRNSVLRVLGGVLSGGMSSRLFERMRNELGICYYVNASADPFTDHGVFSVSAGVKNDRLKEAVKEIIIQLGALKAKAVPDKELAKVKDFLTGGMYLGLESSDSLADFYGSQEIIKKPIRKPEEIAAEIVKVTAADIQKLANEIFVDEKLNLALIGPSQSKSELRKILTFGK